MKDKMKGLLLGLTLGTMMTGSLAYATNSTQIEVYFRELKFMFDGVEKSPNGQSAFIYDGSTYVPLRFVGETLGKEVGFDNDTGTIWIGKNYGGQGKEVVATYQGGSVTKVELDSYLAAYAFFTQQGAPSEDSAYKQSMLKQLIALKLHAAKADATVAEVAVTTSESELKNIRQYFGSAEALANQLRPSNLTELDLKEYVKLNVMARQGLEQSIDDGTLQAEYDRQKKADIGAFVTATVRHILISTSDPASGKQLRTEAEALARAKEVQDKLAKGGNFDELAKTYSDDPGSKDNGGRYTDAEISSYVEPFKKAAAELPLHKLSDPVQTQFGYHLIEVEARSSLSLDEVKPQLKQQLIGQTLKAYVDNTLPGLIEKVELK